MNIKSPKEIKEVYLTNPFLALIVLISVYLFEGIYAYDVKIETNIHANVCSEDLIAWPPLLVLLLSRPMLQRANIAITDIIALIKFQ